MSRYKDIDIEVEALQRRPGEELPYQEGEQAAHVFASGEELFQDESGEQDASEHTVRCVCRRIRRILTQSTGDIYLDDVKSRR